MKLKFAIILATIASLYPGEAATVLNYIPGPDDTGGMIMPGVGFNATTKTFSVSLGGQSDTAYMYPLQEFEVRGQYPYADAVFDPSQSSAGWYSQLDPTQGNKPFSTQFGFYLTSGNVSSLPTGSYVYIKVTSISDGLRGYDVGYWEDVWDQENPSSSEWLQVYGEGSLWGDNVAWGDSSGLSMWHPVFVADGPGNYSATFEIYLGDGFAEPVDGWTSASITLNWVAVPEPSSIVLMALGAAFFLVVLRRRFSHGLRQ